MDIKEFKRVKIINTANARIVSHAFSIPYDEEVTIDTFNLPEHVLEDLKVFQARGQIEIVPVEDKPKKAVIEKHTETVRSANGKEHVVYRPQDKLINVESIDTSGKSIDVAFSRMDAVDLLSKHWKTLEKAVSNMNDKKELELLVSVARENGVADKKLEIVQNRLGELV